MGYRHGRVRGQAYDDFVDAYVAAARKLFPKAMLHWEDFGSTFRHGAINGPCQNQETSPVRVSLFVPCYIDVFEPQVGIVTLELLRRFGIDPTYPLDQTCCGQPMVNAGCHAEAAATEAHLARTFADCDYIVVPSGSCAHQVRCHMTAVEQTEEVRAVRARTYELVEFLHDILEVDAFPWAEFPHKVSYHNNCNALRGIRHGSASELREAPF